MRFSVYLPKQSVVKFDLRLGAISFSIVRNESWVPKARSGGFISRFDKGFMSTLRIGQTYINLDVWA